MKKVLAAVLCAVMLVSALSIGTCVSADDVKRPSGFMPWYSFENLNVGASPSITEDREENDKSVMIGGLEAISAGEAMNQKIGLLKCEVVEGGAAGKLLKYGAGDKLKTDNKKYEGGVWWPITIDQAGDENVNSKEFSNAEYFCFYIDMSKWTTDARREADVAEGKEVGMTIFINVGHVGDDGALYYAACSLKDGNNYELQQPDGSWKVVASDVNKDKVFKDVEIPSTGATVSCAGENANIKIPTTFKGYVRFKLSDTYEATYFDAADPAWGIRHQSTFRIVGLQFHTGLYPQACGIGGDDNTTEPGYYLYGDFGFLPADSGAQPVVNDTKSDEPKADESKEEDSKAEDSQVEESKVEESKIEASKADESVVPAQNSTEEAKSHKGLWITLGIILVVLIGGGVAAFFIVKKQKANAIGSEAVMDDPDVSQPEDDSSDNTDDKNE